MDTNQILDKAYDNGVKYGQTHELVEAPLSGEWADGLTTNAVLAEVGVDVYDTPELADEVIQEWLNGYDTNWA